MILSIIVPVYNVEKYLAKCIDSLLQQDLAPESYEIILVNDGSTDGSEAIANAYAKKYSNIKLITQVNKGLSGARNTGIRLAKGEYIQFVDSDDYITPNCLSALLQQLQKDSLQVLRYNYQKVDENYAIIPKSKNALNDISYSTQVETGEVFLANRLGFACFACMFIIQKDFLLRNELYFKEGIYFEDTEWLPRVLIKTSTIASTPTIVYHYLQRVGSITQSVDIHKKNKVANDVFDNIIRTNQLMYDYPSEYVSKWVKKTVALSVLSLINYILLHFPGKYNYYIDKLKHENIFPLSRVNTTTKQRLHILFINISPSLYRLVLKK